MEQGEYNSALTASGRVYTAMGEANPATDDVVTIEHGTYSSAGIPSGSV
jgi:hypothetical protein